MHKELYKPDGTIDFQGGLARQKWFSRNFPGWSWVLRTHRDTDGRTWIQFGVAKGTLKPVSDQGDSQNV